LTAKIGDMHGRRQRQGCVAQRLGAGDEKSAMPIVRVAHFLLCRLPAPLAATAIIVASAVGARAQDDTGFHELETKYIFGDITVGSSTGIEGEKAFEPETGADFGKRGGNYAASLTELEYEYTPNQFVQLEFGPTVSYYDIHGVGGLNDLNLGTFNGFAGTFRSVLVDRGPSPLAVTLSLEPEFHRRDETSGTRIVNYELEAKLETDYELINNRLFFASNLLYEPETTRGDLGAWFNESTFGISSALAYQIVPKVVVGADFWYMQHYAGVGFNTFTGDAYYLGPTVYWQVSSKLLVSAAWETQIAGHEAGVSPALDLTDFSHYRAKLLLEFEF
jgi:hypothetical protein